ncbi:MAG: amidohydrolase family protein [Burkholderiales bacterium]|nr:amidohydrolase family protein [Burkholderiales bacterium]
MTTLDLLIEDVTLLTGTPAAPVLRNASIGLAADRIAWIGTGEAPGARNRLPLPGRVVTPGLVNVHTHAILTMVRGVAEDLGFAPAYTPGIPHGHDVTPDEACALARLGALEALLFGSTLINDSYVHAGVTAPAMAELGLRVWTCGRIHDADFSLIGDGRWEYDDAIGERTLGEAVALAQAWHGKAEGRLGVQLAAHAPDTCSDRLLHRIAAEADRLGLRVNTHLAQSRVEVQQVLARSGRTPAQVLDEAGLLNDRLLAAHCLFLSEEDMARAGRAGIHVAHIPKGNAAGGTMAPTPRLRAAGANIALGTDNMHADMVEVMRWALAVARVQEGKVGDDWQPRHALRMATIDGARAMGLDADIGSLEAGKKADFVAFDFRRPHLVPKVNPAGTLEVGKKADLVVFDFRRAHLTPDVNPLGNLVHVGQGRDVEHVFVDGRRVVESGRPCLVDADAIRRDAQRAADALWARARA